MWDKPPLRVSTKPPPRFSCSSFKDIQLLCSDDQQPPHASSKSPRSPSIFHRVRLVNSIFRTWSTRLPSAALPPPPISLPGTENRVVIFFTSLRVVRSTFDDCRAVRSILRSFRVSIDERDVTMDHNYMDELKRIFGKHSRSKVGLPRVFIGGKYIGGAEEIGQLHESGELKNLVGGLPAAPLCGSCDFCGGFRFILCDECSGSHKCYSEKGGFRMCTVCNENGLIRCPYCSYA